MKTVIFCNRLDLLRRFLNGVSSPLRHISLVETKESRRINDYLRGRPDTEELPKSQLFRERSEEFRRKYIEFMGRLNSLNHSQLWWAMTFTNKNPQSATLCRSTADFLLVLDLLRSDARRLLVITENPALVKQTEALAAKEQLQVVNLVKATNVWRTRLKLNSPAGAIRASFRTILLWALSRRLRPRKGMTDSYLVIATLVHPRCLSTPFGYRDAYFGALVEHISTAGPKSLILANLAERPFEQLKRIKNLEFGVPVVPVESCLTFFDLVECTLRALWTSIRPIRVKGHHEIDGVDVSVLVEQAVHEGCHSGDLFLNLRMFYSARGLARTIRIDRYLYPFENRSWEKMLLLGIRHASPETQLVGYQHAALTMAHTNLMLGPGESDITPLPKTIFTTGTLATDWLAREGGFPIGIFRTACALRQGQINLHQDKSRGRKVTNVLVALATNLEEYIDTLSFLEEAFAGSECYQVRIRPHPEFALESALSIAPPSQSDFFSESTDTLEGDLSWADVVLYASSTVGLEAVSLGIPAVHLDLGDFLNRDPMSGWNEFRWSVEDPADLINTLSLIQAIPGDEFLERQKKGFNYVAAYLTPPTTERLLGFVSV